MSDEKIENLADINARIITDYLNTLEEKASSLNSVVSTYADLSPSMSKDLTRSFFTSTLSDDRIFGIYLALEPDRFYANTPDGYSFYAYHSGEGDGVVYEFYPYDDYKDGDFYTIPKQTLQPHITEPYSWTLTNGQVIWLVTISIPLLDSNGGFMGITSCDVSLDTINDLAFNMGGYETAYSYILTNQGTYVVHSDDETKSGTLYAEDGQTEQVLSAAASGEPAFFEDLNQVYGGKAFKVQVPVKINGIDSTWSSAFVVSQSEVLGSVYKTIYTIIGASVAGILILLLLTLLFLRKDLKPVQSLVAVAANMEAGQLESDIQVKTKDELGELSRIFNRTANTLKGYITEISNILDKISNGDLTVSSDRDYAGDFEPIKSALLSILSSLNDTFCKINTAAEQVSSGSAMVASSAQTLASGATEQAATIQVLTASVTQISDEVNRNAENVKHASSCISQASRGVHQSNESMLLLLSAMQKIDESSAQISGIIKIIDDISFQTNILALNAAVEAARAGVAGKGFAVVAEEVRNLAAKSAGAANQTSDLINHSIGVIKEGMQLAQSTSSSLSEVSEKVLMVESTNAEIDKASSSQAMAISEIERGLQQVSDVIQTITATAEENASASEELSTQAARLSDYVSLFTLKDNNNY